MDLFDENGRQIARGDVLKVFHFTGARRKRHYMYKQAIEYVTLNEGRSHWLKISHLNRLHDEAWVIGDNYYLEHADGRVLKGYEIVQSKLDIAPHTAGRAAAIEAPCAEDVSTNPNNPDVPAERVKEDV